MKAMKLKIFISSTYKDLKAHREVVDKSLRIQGHDVRQMAIFGARDEEPTVASLSELGKCDLMIGIYAHRYGFIPENTPYSITEQEYWHAKSKNIPILCFIKEEEYPWNPLLVDEGSAKEKLSEFIKAIKKEKTVDFFTTPDSLASAVNAAVSRYVIEQAGDDAVEDFPPDHPRLRTSLPYLPYFFGREKERKIITETLKPDVRSWGILIDGPGGIGKTALAIKAAQDAPGELFDRKIFITAKSSELTPAGPRPLTEYARISYLSMLNELAYELGEESIPKLPESDRARTLRRAMTKQRSLIIFDNLENMEDREANKLYQFLSLLPEGNKALVTSRRRSDIDVKTVRLNQLNPHEVKELIAELAKNNPLLRNMALEDEALLILHTGGNPLLIKWVAGQLGRKGSSLMTIKEAIRFMKIASQKNDPLEYIFGDLVSTLYHPEKLVLASLTHLSSITPEAFKWISHMTDGLSKSNIEYIFDELNSRSILNSDTKATVYYLPSVTSNFIRSNMSEEVSLTGHRLQDYVYRLVTEFNSQRDYNRIKDLETDWPAILATLPFFFKGENQQLQFICESLAPFLKFSGRWDDWLWILENAEKKARDSGDFHSAGLRAYEMALLHSYRGQPADIAKYRDLAINHWSKMKLGPTSVENGLTEYIVGIAILENNYEVAIRHFKTASDILRTSEKAHGLLAQVLASLGGAQRETGYLDEANKNLTEALEIAEMYENIEDVSIYKANLADLALIQRDWVKADELARSALQLAEQIGQQEEIARSNYLLAQSLFSQGFPAQAYTYARTSAGIYTKLRHQYLSDVQVLLSKCKDKMKKS